LVATVVPIFTDSTSAGVIGAVGGDAEQATDPRDRGIAILLWVVGEQLQRRQRAVGALADDVGEGAAAIDPELPAARRGFTHDAPLRSSRRRGARERVS
jgi:hypothetical protein